MTAPLIVHRARVAGFPATRGDVERWLSRVPVESLGLARDELFYVPLLQLRLPRGGGGAFVPELVLAKLRALLAAAGRGKTESFSPGRAFRFASRSRYYAWLVRPWVDGGPAAAREAFKAATGHGSLEPWQRRTVLREAPELVATIARLAETGHAARWLQRFDAADHAVARHALRSGFGLALPEPPAPRPAQPSPAAPEAADAPVDPPTLRLRETVEALRIQGNDWHSLPRPARALLLACALIARAPAHSARDAPRLGPRVAAFAAEPEARAAVPAAGDPPAARARPAAPPGLASRSGGIGRTEPAPSAARPDAPAGRTLRRHHENVEALPTAGDPGGRAPDDRPPRLMSPGRIGESRPSPTAQPLLAPDSAFDSRFGGVLFLVNAFVALGLYPDFTEPLGRRLGPSPLWLAGRIGRYWFGARYRRDPLAAWIGANAAGGRLPREWRAKEEWLGGFGAARAPRLTRRGAMTTLWHPAGFPLLDGPEPRLAPLLRRLARRSRAAPGRASARLPAHGPDRWTACLALYLDARLHLSGPGLSLLELPARVSVRDLDLHAGFSLDGHPIALRMAGLDRNPGWQPAEGRSIAFGFE
ncbi:MAG TPA: hypothetical protein VF619_08660 [Allosphingosinicella sp.]